MTFLQIIYDIILIPDKIDIATPDERPFKPSMIFASLLLILYWIKTNMSDFNDLYSFSLGENNFFYYEDEHGGLKLPMPNLIGQFQLSNVATTILTLMVLINQSSSSNGG